MEYFTYVLFRFAHTLVGIVWIGLLYYFNFVQTEYLKEAEPDAKSDVLKNLHLMLCGGSDGQLFYFFNRSLYVVCSPNWSVPNDNIRRFDGYHNDA